MAKTLTTPTSSDKVYATFPIVKWEEDKDGNLVVYGKATDGSVDSDEQIVDSAWSSKALADWMASGPNVRVQHNPQLYPAGNGLKVEVNRDGDGAHWVKSLVVEPTAKTLVRHGALRAYSVGISRPVVERDLTGKARGGIIKGGELAEISLVDRPANRNCGITLVKSAGQDGAWQFGDVDELLRAIQDEEALKAKKKPAPGDEPDDESDTDAPDEPDTDNAEPNPTDDMDTKKAYAAQVAQWRAEEPKRDGAPLSGTEFLMKHAAWQKWADIGELHHLDGSTAGYAAWKRDFDPGVGGGVDRDKLPEADFGDPGNRKYPIVIPKDVEDAWGLSGHAGDPDAVRSRIKAIARRKGPEFVAALPDTATEKARKGGLQCPKCDTFNKRSAVSCRACGTKLGGKMADADVDKNIGLTSPNPDGLVPYNLVGQKGMKDCPECGADYDADSKQRRCESCGAKLPKAKTAAAKEQVGKGKKRRLVPPDVQSAGAHREPDGGAVEALEADAGMSTTPDATPDDVPASVKTYSLHRMHDALCAAYDWNTVKSEYPAMRSVADAVTPGFFRGRLQAYVDKGDFGRVALWAGLTQSAETIAKGLLEPELLRDARAEVRKSFTDMYPDVKVTPGSITAGQFQRSYISAGHAPLNASGAGAPSIPPASHTLNPDDFNRGLITDGHQASSPSNKTDNLATPSVRSGASRVYYMNATRDAARNAMQAMHDHIAASFPEMCPMAPSRAVLPPDMGDGARPRPVAPLAVPAAPGEKAAKGDRLLLKAMRAAVRKEMAATQPALDVASTVKTAVAEMLLPYENKMLELQAELDALGARPDPAQAPLRGVVRSAASSEPAPVEKRSLVEEAQVRKAAAETADYLNYLRMMVDSPNPATREQAETELSKMLGR